MKEGSIYKVSFIVLLLSITRWGFSQQVHPVSAVEPLFDLKFTNAERDSMKEGLADYEKAIRTIHQFKLDNSVPMSLLFDPLPQGFTIPTQQAAINWGLPTSVQLPGNREELAFYPVYKLSVLMKTRKITSLELTRLYLKRLKKYSDTLQCSITILEETALQQARKADQEIAGGKYRGPLHGIPYGIKDLLAVPGFKTTWGATPYKDQVIDARATVVSKLENAGAVLMVKLTLGALAMGDIWYGGVTKNPWNLKEGSSGSSAGSASATVAGLVAFSIGTETLGSIVSPSARCGASGLRPTYGRVSRYGAMALSWSMDKIGPICRSILDCAIVLDAIRGQDGLDHFVHNAAFNYNTSKDIRKLKVGYFKSLFDSAYEGRENDLRTLETLKGLGVNLVPLEFPSQIPVGAIELMLSAEAAAAFDELTRSNRDSLLTVQSKWAWPNVFRTARFIPAVDYINASRIRYLLVQDFYKKTAEFDVIITPTFEGNQLLTTNLTGNPCAVVPNGNTSKGDLTSISFIGKLFGEADIILLARAYQDSTEWEAKIPPLFKN